MSNTTIPAIACIACLSIYIAPSILADDWPQYRYNASRTAESEEELADKLGPSWEIRLPKPVRAWKDASNRQLSFDTAYEPVVMGKRLFLGSMNDDAVRAYDTETGKELWCFYTEGPVRFAPAGYMDKLYVTSDDGLLYCLSADKGELLWKFHGGPTARRAIGNQRMIGLWPARTGAAVCDGKVYFAAGIWPFMGCFIHAVDAESGEVIWTNSGKAMQYQGRPHGAGAFSSTSPQGYISVKDMTVTVPNTRQGPLTLDRRTGLTANPAKAKFPGANKPGTFKGVQVGDKVYTMKGNVVSAVKGKQTLWSHTMGGGRQIHHRCRRQVVCFHT